MSLPDLNRVRFSLREFRRTTAIEDPQVLVREPLSTELEFSTLLENELDAEEFGQFILDLRKGPRGTWTLSYVREDERFQIGDTISVEHPRLGLQDTRDFIIKGIQRDSSSTETLTLFGPL